MIIVQLLLSFMAGFLVYRLLRTVLLVALNKPDLIIGDRYLLRWYVLPRNKWFNVYLHNILQDDEDRALHDHPWNSISFMLKGSLREVYFNRRMIPAHLMQNVNLYLSRNLRPSFKPVFRSARYAHRLEVIKPTWTLFITGRKVRDWGFHCPNDWVPWQEFVDPSDTGKVGRGCGE